MISLQEAKQKYKEREIILSPVMFKVELFTMASAFMNFQENIEKVGMPVD